MNQCSICSRKFANAELLQSNQDEYFCKECFKYEYCANRQLSPKKKSMLPNKCEGDFLLKTRKMFSSDELATLRRERTVRSDTVASKRPLQCPHVDCNRYVSIFDLTAHFQHEHMEVCIGQTCLDTRNPLTFYPADVRYGVKQCLILLNILPTNEETNNASGVSQAEKHTAPLTVVVLASRIAAAQLNEENAESALEEDDQKGSPLGSNDKIIIWMASNVVCPYSYTVAASTVSEDVRVKYYGPVPQLRDGPKALCLNGQCLVLSHFHFLGMSENGVKPLHLDVIIHSED